MKNAMVKKTNAPSGQMAGVPTWSVDRNNVEALPLRALLGNMAVGNTNIDDENKEPAFAPKQKRAGFSLEDEEEQHWPAQFAPDNKKEDECSSDEEEQNCLPVAQQLFARKPCSSDEDKRKPLARQVFASKQRLTEDKRQPKASATRTL